MASETGTPAAIERPTRAARKCGICGLVGHDRRNCPDIEEDAVQVHRGEVVIDRNGLTNAPLPTPLVRTNPFSSSLIDWEAVLYVVFDLETTGRNRQRNEIIELGAAILDENGIPIEDAEFAELIKPTRQIPSYITHLTTITNEQVSF